ncbi:MAG: carbohydrate ABC transporter permease [Acetanaerobacterium sp.]
MKNSAKNRAADIVCYTFLIIVAITCIFPFYVMFINATHSNSSIMTKIALLPGKNITANLHWLTQRAQPMRMMLNSLIISVSSTALSAYIGALTAYGFSKFRFKGNTVLFWVVLATMMIPTQMSLIGLAQISHSIGILGSYWPVILPSMASASTVFWLRAHFAESVHNSLIEAARVEGYNELAIFHRIALPLSKTGIATISIFNFVNAWNNYLTPLTLLSDAKKFPISIGIAIIRTIEPRDLGALYLGLAISVIPILIVFACLSRYILAGLASGAVKG